MSSDEPKTIDLRTIAPAHIGDELRFEMLSVKENIHPGESHCMIIFLIEGQEARIATQHWFEQNPSVHWTAIDDVRIMVDAKTFAMPIRLPRSRIFPALHRVAPEEEDSEAVFNLTHRITGMHHRELP